MEILATLHPDNNPNDDLFPNVKKENIPSKAINLEKLSDEVKKKLPKVISSDSLLPATKLKYLEIDGTTYYIPQLTDITSNIKITANKSDILASDHKLLCLLNNKTSLAIKVVDKIEGGSEEISTLSEVLPQGISGSCCARHDNNIYIFGGYNGSNAVNTIYKFNCTNKTIETISTTLLQALNGACCATYRDNIYIFGGYNGSYRLDTIYKFNCSTETITELSATLPQTIMNSCCEIYNNNIYIFGGSNMNASNVIYKFNCDTESITTLGTSLPNITTQAFSSIYNNYVYIFGGNNGKSGSNLSVYLYIYKFDCDTEKIKTLSVYLPKNMDNATCEIYADDIYIFGGRANNSYLNTIYKFNCSTETITKLSTTLPQAFYRACGSIYNNNIYIFGGYNGSYLNAIYNFSVSFELTANNVLIYNANSDYSFELVTNQVTIPIKNIYIGDSTNTAQLAHAYLYDQSQSAWVNVNTGEVLTL